MRGRINYVYPAPHLLLTDGNLYKIVDKIGKFVAERVPLQSQNDDLYRREGKVVADVLGTNLNAALAIYCNIKDYLKTSFLKIIIFSEASIPPSVHCSIHPILQIILALNLQCGKALNQFCPPNNSDDLCLLFCINPSSMVTLLE